MKRVFLTGCVLTAALMMLSQGVSYAAEASYGFVDVALIFDEYQKTKDNDEVLKQEGEKKERDREDLVKQIRAMKDELVLLSDEAKEKKQEALDEKVRQLQDFDRDAKRDLAQERNKLVREIFRDIDDVVQRYGERKGFDLIFNERALLYHSAKLDVTQDVLKELNKDYKK